MNNVKYGQKGPISDIQFLEPMYFIFCSRLVQIGFSTQLKELALIKEILFSTKKISQVCSYKNIQKIFYDKAIYVVKWKKVRV